MELASGWSVEWGMIVRERGDGPPVLWVHGLGESGLCFERVLDEPALAGFRHLVPDLPGYGRSPWPASPPSLAETADHLVRWLGDRGEPPVAVVGHSMGGVVATLMAERHPERLRAVVNIDGNLSSGDCAYSGEAARHPPGDFVIEGFDRLKERVLALGIEDPAHRGYWASLRLADPATFHLHSRELVELSAGETLAGRLAALPMPTTYVAGFPGGACTHSLQLAESAGVGMVRIEPSGHWPFIDRPEELADRVRPLLG